MLHPMFWRPSPAALPAAGRLAVVAALGLAVVASPTAANADVTSNRPARTWGVNGQVSVLLPVGDRIYLGGSFTSLVDPSGVSYPAKNLAVITASTGAGDLSFSAGTDTGVGTKVTALATDGERLFVGGLFKSINGSPRTNLAAVDLSTGALSPGWTASANASVDALTVADGSLYAGGLFSNIRNGGTTLSQPYLAKLDAVSGAIDTTWSPTPNDRVRSLTRAADGSGRLFLGGEFTTVSGRTTHQLAAVGLAAPGTVDTGFLSGASNNGTYQPIYDLTADAGQVYAAVAGPGGACTAFATATGATVWSKHSNGNMQSVRRIGTTLYCGGHYGGTASFAGLDRQKLASVSTADGSVTSFAPQINSPLGVWSLAADATHVYVGGDFTSVTGVPQLHYAEFLDPAAQGPPGAPTLHAQPGNAVVHLSWTAPSTDNGAPVTKYKVYRSTTSGSYGTAVLASTGSATRTYDDTAVSNATTYYYRVVALNAFGAGAAGGEAAATPDASITPVPPTAPVGLTAANPAGYVSLTWNPPVDNGGAPVTSYDVYRGAAPGTQALHATTGSTSYRDTAIVAGTTYYYTVTAVSSVGLEGPPSNEDFTTAQPGLPGAPTLSGSAGPHVSHLSWSVPPDGGTPITRYVVLRDNLRLVNLGPSVTSYDDTKAVAGTTYVYQVKAQNAEGSGQLSNKVTLTPS
jgi:hypothetical protein